ncbi:MAG: CocE/NonD family hydrolase [Gemmatimonadota bacterium]|nr:CocE/NonD family hydrolase [Gemmatimonadota bacterium]
MILRRTLILAALASGLTRLGAAQDFTPPPARSSSDTAFHEFISSLARQLSREYKNPDREAYLDNLARILIVAGNYTAADSASEQLRVYRAGKHGGLSPLADLAYQIYAVAKAKQSAQNLPSVEALNQAFAERAGRVDDASAAVAMPFALGAYPGGVRIALDAAIARANDAASLPLAGAIDLIRRYAALRTYELIAPELDRLLREDDARRYIITRDLLVTTPDGARICTLIVRPRNPAAARLPTLLNFTIYASDINMFEARRSASHGYVAVEGLTRGKGCSPDAPISHEHDGTDAAALIEWISRQPWSDGRVGMYGGSYEGFTQWAAAKYMPKALKAMMPSVTHAPGIDFPMEGGVYANFAYPWPFFTTNRKGLDSATYDDSTRWARLDTTWYKSGRPYRELAAIDGTPNPTFERWVSHPSYDAYWQRMIPYRNEFTRIDIPVLTTTGYYDGGQVGALFTFREHRRYAPRAKHYLVIGPYDHITGQRGTMDPIGRVRNPAVRGYRLDSVAHMDIGELRYEWFDHIFKGAPKPDVLRDVVNYQVMGSNVWKHAPSIARMANGTKSIALGRTVNQVVDLADRTDAAKWGRTRDLFDPSSSERAIIDTAANIAHSFEVQSEPFNEATEISGLFSGRLEFLTNKKDFDASITLFEQMADGKYFQLSHMWIRMSYAPDRTRRKLLTGKRQQISFEANRLTSKRLSKGSRIVAVIAVTKNPSTQINYGTGRAVSDESIADAREPLRISWLPATRIDVPVAGGYAPASTR